MDDIFLLCFDDLAVAVHFLKMITFLCLHVGEIIRKKNCQRY